MSFMKFFKSLLEHKPSQVGPPAALKPSLTPNQVETNTAVPTAFKNTSGTSQIKAIKPHVPLIKFRKGGLPDASNYRRDYNQPRNMYSDTIIYFHSLHSGSSQSASHPPSGSSKRKGTAAQPPIEDYQLPHKYRRQPLDEKEIDYINRGGPE